MVNASDGLWDQLKAEEVAWLVYQQYMRSAERNLESSFSHPAESPEKKGQIDFLSVSEHLSREARKLWMAKD